MLQTIEIINELTMGIPESTVQSENVDTRSLLNFAVTDGHSIICTRYVSSKTDEAASLYFSSGTQWETKPSASGDRDYQMERRDKGADIVLVASEPLTFERGNYDLDNLSHPMLTNSAENWVNVPTNSVLTIHGQTVMVNPIIDGFSDRDPCHKRSSAFAQTKGLTTNEKATPPVPTAGLDPEAQRRIMSPMIPSGLGRSRTPEILPLPLRGRTPLSQSETSSVPSDIRSVTSPPPERPGVMSKLSSQGNIKKKRRSLNLGEYPHPAEFTEPEPQTPPSPVQSTSRTCDYVTAEKAARVLGMAL
jgi:glutamine amidotransferase